MEGILCYVLFGLTSSRQQTHASHCLSWDNPPTHNVLVLSFSCHDLVPCSRQCHRFLTILEGFALTRRALASIGRLQGFLFAKLSSSQKSRIFLRTNTKHCIVLKVILTDFDKFQENLRKARNSQWMVVETPNHKTSGQVCCQARFLKNDLGRLTPIQSHTT